ncbi:MAG: hypothetical protein ABI881_02670 [Betaproteobacteria bacterium]
MQFSLRLAGAALVSFALLAAALPASAARIGVLSNRNADVVANDFAAHFSGHAFTAVDVSGGPPDLASLLAAYDEILLFEDNLFQQAPLVGDRVYQFAQSGRPVILSTFYEQDRSDRAGVSLPTPHGWGLLESIDPNTSDTIGASTAPRTLDPASIVAHPLTAGVTSLFANKGLAGGNQAKPGTLVVARWAQPNANNQPDPAIALRLFASACVMHVAIAPDYSLYGTFGVDFGGDFYQVWKNAFDYGSGNCGRGWQVPAITDAMLAALALLLLTLAALTLRRRAAR